LVQLGFSAFVAFGAVLVLVGACQATLARDLGLGLEQTGLLAAVLSGGLGIGVAVAGPIADRRPRRGIFVVACSCAGIALAGAASATSFGSIAIALALLGASTGAMETTVNVSLSAGRGEQGARRLAFVHAGATLGAVLGAPALGAASLAYGHARGFGALAMVWVLLALLGSCAPFPPPVSHADAGRWPARSAAQLWPLLGIAAAYVGFETALTALVVPYASGLGLPDAVGVTAISAFWLGLLLGRLVLVLRPGLGGERALAWLACGATALLASGVVLGITQVALWLGAIGICLGGVFPALVSATARRFPDVPATAIGIVIAAGSAGGFAWPWLVGAIGDRAGVRTAVASLGVALAVLVLCAGVLVVQGRARAVSLSDQS